jgi:DNA invertase Pin-like site-specific DNA recombinase
MFVEEASGAQPLDARPKLTAALSALRSGQADMLIVPTLPMVSRSITELLPWLVKHFGEGSRHGLIAVQEDIDTRQAAGRFAVGVLSALSLCRGGGRYA